MYQNQTITNQFYLKKKMILVTNFAIPLHYFIEGVSKLIYYL